MFSGSVPTPGTPASTQQLTYSLSCPACRKTVYFDENGAQNLPRYRAMQNIVDKFIETKTRGTLGTLCQLCEPGPATGREATVFCEQCQVFYCDPCRDSCHPARGPLAKHSLVSPHQGRILARTQQLQQQHNQLKVVHLFISLLFGSIWVG